MGLMETPLLLYNTLTQNTEAFTPLEPGKVKMYVCGPTVYDAAHLGHARCYITWDVLFRFLRFSGLAVTYVRNVTDVDDKILKRAHELGCPPQTVAENNYQSFQDDMEALNVLPPTHEPHATQYIQEMLQGIQALLDKGAAYATPDGTVYYRTASKADYGKLSKKPLDDLQAGARVEVDPNKESPLDFALWKGVAADDPVAWETPWGRGRPGWHMECSAMSHSLLGDQLDIHAGGADLIFPHHENEIAQSEAWTGKTPFVRYWLHNGFVNVSGEKMSKSLGNFSTIKTLLKAYDSNTIRYFLLTNHYRMPVDFSDEALAAARNRMTKIHRTLKAAAEAFQAGPSDLQPFLLSQTGTGPERYPQLWAFQEAMQNDLNTAQALAILNADLLPEINKSLLTPAALDTLKALFQQALSIFYHLGFDLTAIFRQEALPAEPLRTLYKELTGNWLAEDVDAETALQQVIHLRAEAKRLQNWPQADAIRKHLSDIGILLKDSKEGTSWELVSHDRAPVS